MAKTAYIGIGSNIGNKLENCLKAIGLIDRVPGCGLVAQSGFFRTEPVGVKGQDWYVNAVISVSADISAQYLQRNLLDIEKSMGRERRRKWDSRTIDLDILLFGEEIINMEDLTIPHPLMHLRRFVLVPMVQLAPHLVHPILGKTMAQLLDNSAAEGQAVMEMGER